MKVPSLLRTLLLAAFAFTAEAQAQQSVQQLLTEAQQNYMRGDLEKARQQFKTVSQIDPKNPTAIGFLRRIQVDLAKTSGNSLEKQFAQVMIPKVEFKEATLGSALDYLKQVLSRTTDGKTTVNFIVQVPEEQVKTQTVTMSVTGLPFTEVLRYFGGLANVQFEYEKYAVVVKPRGATASVTPQAQ